MPAQSTVSQAPPTLAQRALVHERLGREPRGLRAIAVSDEDDRPMVIRVASLVDGKPFPTLFWLVDPELCLRIDRAEASGLIAALQAQVDESETLRAAMRSDHEAHIALRDAYLEDTDRASLSSAGYLKALEERGIGGIADFSRIRCLHTWYAAHLVEPNTIGALLDDYWRQSEGAAH